ncbi:hypothetical protein DL546_006307 [Coniochaeta pulveracea]|uniref:Uncharacterized protein n=1 Tax=Coniochaeta pulveracea TaxID=177199 RepID=A0A420Y6S7_9PEZI|nr:hypothetical protein DL546_006307 [Coniochaeta pulveracea]
MDSRDSDDPFDWDVARVIQELCTPHRTWNPSRPGKHPDPTRLKRKLDEMQVDGQSLLTYEGDGFPLNDLLALLEIKVLPHRLFIGEALRKFKSRSLKYRQWKREQVAELIDQPNLDHTPESEATAKVVRPGSNSEESKPGNVNAFLSDDTGQAANLEGEANTSQPATSKIDATFSGSGVLDAARPLSVSGQSVPLITSHPVSPEIIPNQQPSSKKRRTAPTLLSTAPLNTVPIPVPNPVDVLSGAWTAPGVPQSKEDVQINAPEYSYLGSDGLAIEDMAGLDMSSDDESSDEYSFIPYAKKGAKWEFSFVKTGNKRPGRELQVYRAVKRRLIGKRTENGNGDIHGYGADILGQIGDSDGDYDTDEWEQYLKDVEEEKKEALQKKKEGGRASLKPEEVEAAIEEAIQEYKDRWTEEKRPILMMKANKQWNEARRHGIRNELISKTVNFMRTLDSRIIGQKKQLIAGQWPNKDSLRRQMKDSLQPTIRDRMAEDLKYRILNSPVEPKAPKSLPRPTNIRKKTPSVHEHEDSEVILDSDEEEDMAQFIVDDSLEYDGMDVDDGVPDAADDLMDIDGPSSYDHVPRHERQKSAAAASAEDDAPAPETASSALSPLAEANIDAPTVSFNDVEPDVENIGLLNSSRPLAQDTATPQSEETMDNHMVEHGEENPDLDVNEQGEPEMSSQSPNEETLPAESALDAMAQTSVADQDSPSQGFPAEIQPVPSGDDITAIASMGLDYWSIDHWSNEVENQRGLLIALLSGWPVTMRNKIFHAIEGPEDADTLWDLYIERALKVTQMGRKCGRKAKLGLAFVQLFLSWLDRRPFLEQYTKVPLLSPHDCERNSINKSLFANFREHVQSLIPGFREQEPSQSAEEEDSKTASSNGGPLDPLSGGARVTNMLEKTDSGITEQAGMALDTAHATDIAPPETPKTARTFQEKIEADAADSDDSDGEPRSSVRRKRKRVVRDREAANLRENVFQEDANLEERRRALRETLARAGSQAGDAARFIINETKQDKHAFIHVNPSIAVHIKPHQIDGVRFMWNRIVAMNEQSRQGCLLAHTMGLGKTMQVITLLYAIAEASSSDEKAIKSQIPRNLRDNKVLILCPAGLVDNWHDEFLKWTPKPADLDTTSPPLGFLGHLYKIDAAHSQSQRETIVRRWARSQGVLILGYEMLRAFMKKSASESNIGYASDTSSDIWPLLTREPSIVVADEAHKLKNPNSQTNAAGSNFRTRSRIALTGTPLANNVSDYYSMIHWCAPNFLGPAEEFRADFEIPIKEGLWADDAPAARKFALKRLSVLKSMVSPLVHRMSILALKDDLPQKKEFILYLDWTPMQRQAYTAFLEWVVHNPEAKDMITGGNTMSWGFVQYLGSILAHPAIYGKKLLAKPPEKRRKQPKSIGLEEGGAGSGDDDNALRIPGHILKKLVATTPKSVDGAWTYEDSRKLAVLTRILDECRRVKDKVLVFTHHLATLDFLEAMFNRQKRNYFRLDGRTPISSRQGATKKFNQDDNAEIYLISTTAGGVGLNIQGANRVVIFDFLYVPMEEQQAIGRAYRIGQQKPVFVYWLIVGGTFEESIQNRSVFKMQLQSRVIDKKNPLPWAQRNKTLFPLPREVEQHDLSEFAGRDVVLDAVLGTSELQGSVRKVIATEAFEEEVKNDELSAEDRKEIEDMLAQRKFQRENPGAIISTTGLPTPSPIPQMGQAASAYPNTVPYGRGSSGFPPSLWTNPKLRRTPSDGQSNPQLPRELQPMALPSANAISPQADNCSSAPPLFTTDALSSASLTQPLPPPPCENHVPPAPSNEHGTTDIATRRANASTPQPVAAGAPIAAPGTQMRISQSTVPPEAPTVDTRDQLCASVTQGVPSASPGTAPEEQESLPVSQAIPSATQALPSGSQATPSTGKKPFGFTADQKVIRDKQTVMKQLLMPAYSAYEGHHFRDIMTPEEVAAIISKAIEVHSLEFVLVLDFYTTLTKCLGTSARLPKAIIYGAISAEELVTMNRREFMALVDRFDDMDEVDFREELTKGIQKTSVRLPRHDDSDRDNNDDGSNESDKIN